MQKALGGRGLPFAPERAAGAHLSTALYLSHLPSSALERSTVMSKRWVVDFYELPGGVTEAILRRTRLTVFHTGIVLWGMSNCSQVYDC